MVRGPCRCIAAFGAPPRKAAKGSPASTDGLTVRVLVPVVSALLASAATTLTASYALPSRVDRLERMFGDRVDRLERMFGDRVDRLESKLDRYADQAMRERLELAEFRGELRRIAPL